jgi:GNAT superfamily N-acetyltransferase
VDPLIERAVAADLPALPGIERAAGAAFEGWDVPAAEFDVVTSLDDLRHALDAGLLWVAREADAPIGFALVDFLDGLPHLEEIDVHPSHGRRGVGRALVAAVLDWARAAGHAAVTLTSFRDVPWNAPFYARLGFRILEPAELTPGLAEILRDEAARGFDPERRVAMRIELDP